MLSNPSLVEGHLLVIPKRHILKPSELNSEERKEIFDTVIEYQEKITEVFTPGCDIRQNYRPFQPQNDLKVDHVHFHLQPRSLDDELFAKCDTHQREIFHMLSKLDLNKTIKELKG